MNFNVKEDKPIFIQVSNFIEDNIVLGIINEENQIPSTTELSVTYKINPATALKGINLLVEKNILYKKRGLGVFVQSGAKKIILEKRKKEFLENYIDKLVVEGKKLKIEKEEIIKMIEMRW